MPVHIAAPSLHPLGSRSVPGRPGSGPGEAISFSRFASFVIADDADDKEVAVAVTRRELGRYSNALDYWALLRTQIVAHHRFRAGPDGGALDAAVELAPVERRWHYARAVAEYRALLGGRSVAWLGSPKPALWLAEGLQVRVNPELHLSVDGAPLVIKLFLRWPESQAVTPDGAAALVHLLDTTHGHLGLPVLFDVLRGRAFGPPRTARRADPRLRAEARALVGLWTRLDGEAPTEPIPAVSARSEVAVA